jgi:hypothetical protein
MSAGCATTATPKVAEQDPVDAIIAQSALSATQALRDLSESSGNTRVVLTGKPAPAPAPAAAAVPAPVAAKESAVASRQAEPASAEAPVSGAAPTRIQGYQSIAARSGSIAVEVPTPTTFIASPSSGVVASGGLLSAPPAGLEKLVTVRWTGELEQLLQRIAEETGWKLAQSTGTRVSPVIISVNADNRSAFDVLRDIGAIAGTSADIVIASNARTFTVRYPQR